MTDVSWVIRRFPAHELAVRRQYASDLEFRDACEHYALAVRALETWEADDAMAEEYRQIVKELEDKLRQFLNRRERTLIDRGRLRRK